MYKQSGSVQVSIHSDDFYPIDPLVNAHNHGISETSSAIVLLEK